MVSFVHTALGCVHQEEGELVALERVRLAEDIQIHPGLLEVEEHRDHRAEGTSFYQEGEVRMETHRGLEDQTEASCEGKLYLEVVLEEGVGARCQV